MSVTALATLLTAIGALIAGIAALWRIRVDRKHGLRGTELQADTIDITRFQAAFEAHNGVFQNVLNDNATIREENKELKRRMAKIEHRQDYTDKVIRVYAQRENLLIKHIWEGRPPPPPELPPIPEYTPLQ